VKKRKALLIITLVALTIVSLAFIWQWESGTIDYWLEDTMKYQLINGQWQSVNYATNASSLGIYIPVHCRNDGFSVASFDLIISFKNAIYNGSTDEPKTLIAWEKINDTTAKYSYMVNPHSSQSINVSFQIENETKGFVVSLAFQSNQLLQVESAQKGSQPWQTVYRTLYFGQSVNNTYVAAHIS
jgi:hypothetical protein